MLIHVMCEHPPPPPAPRHPTPPHQKSARFPVFPTMQVHPLRPRSNFTCKIQFSLAPHLRQTSFNVFLLKSKPRAFPLISGNNYVLTATNFTHMHRIAISLEIPPEQSSITRSGFLRFSRPERAFRSMEEITPKYVN
ncbi:hypothetical protein Zmor_022399 [Zophobas morio]|uniref:Uncharacterized protein n=1 Tax=Zophobas morio TaxID=2755281 RepID=A0AA38HWG2_9CUCU|nr:hypothetical protein Zmor_022399 [Zophobas morio]